MQKIADENSNREKNLWVLHGENSVRILPKCVINNANWHLNSFQFDNSGRTRCMCDKNL